MNRFIFKCIITITCLLIFSLSSHSAASLPLIMDGNKFNENGVVINKTGTVEWNDDYGICLGSDFGGGFDWNDKFVIIQISDKPDSISFTTKTLVTTAIGSAFGGVTGCEFYVSESADNSSWTQTWKSSSEENTVSYVLKESTRYIKLCFSGNFEGQFRHLRITSEMYNFRIYIDNECVRNERLSPGASIDTFDLSAYLDCKNFVGWDNVYPSVMPSYDYTVSTTLEKKKYTSSFKLSNPELDVDLSDYSKDFYCGDAVEVLSPSLKGYTFNGWSPILPLIVSSEMDGKEYVAQWIRNLYNYKVYTVDENTPAISKQLYYGTPIEELETPSRSGYSFNGWDKENPTTMPAEDVTIRAKWSQLSYRLVVYTTESDSTVSFLHYGDPIATLTAPTRLGYEFSGWDSELPAVMPDHDVSVHANWSLASYRLVVYETENDSTVYTKEYKEELSPLPTPTRKGYAFLQWSVEMPSTMPANDIIVRAIWQKKSYTITLLSDGISFFKKSFAYEDSVDVSDAPVPTKSGYKFMGWDGQFPATMSDEDLTYEAIWKEASFILVLEKDINDPTQNDTLSFDYNDPIKGVLDPEKTGYTFVGWNPELPDSMPAKNLTVTAKWSQNTYRYVIYNTEDDSIVLKTHYNDELPELKDPAYRPGYTFEYWDTEKPATMPANDLTIRAIWSVNTYRYVVYRTESDSTVTLLHYGDPIDELEIPSLTGYDFNGWDKENIQTMTDGDFVIKATWSLAEYKLIMVKGLDFFPEADTLNVLYTKSVNVTDPSHEGYTFDGWTPAIPDAMPAENVTVTAKWSKNKYRYVIYFTESDSVVDNVFYGETLPALEDQVRTGFDFKGWDIEQPSTMPSSDLTIKAVWERKNYTFDLLVDGQIYFTQSFAFGDSIKLTNYTDPSKPGYVFEGWDDDFPLVMPAKNLQYESSWSARKYSLVVVHDNENLLLNDTFYYFCDEKVNKIDALPKTGYTFVGWNDEFPDKMLPRNVILVAKWEANTYTLTFMNEDTVFLKKSFKYGDQIDYKSLPKPTKEGFFFLGWGNDAPNVMPADDVELNAIWSANAYSIVVVNDMDDPSKNDTIYYETNSSIAPLMDPVKEGYSFLGWDVELPAKMPAENIKVVAKWQINMYTLTTLVNCKPTSYTYTYGNSVSVLDPSVEGYSFEGWSDVVPAIMPGHDVLLVADMRLLKFNFITIVDGDTTVIPYNYNDSIEIPATPEKQGFTFLAWDKTIPSVMPSSDVIITASWTRNTYVASFVIGEDTSHYNYFFEDTIRVPKVNAETGYSFLGWNTDIPLVMPAENVIYIAEFTPNNYSFVVISDEDTISTRYPYGADVAPVENPSKIGYSFVGWSKDIPTTMPAYNDTIVAKWSVNSYTLTWIDDNDTIVDTYNYGDIIEKKVNPVKKGYTFLEWNGEIPTVMPAENRVFTAEWEVNVYEITYVNGEHTDLFRYAYDDTIHPVTDPEKIGYKFTGWLPTVPTVMPDSSFSVEAQWEALNYELTVVVDGETVQTVQYHYADTIDSLNTPEKEGYSFAKWIPSVPETMPAENVSVEATWSLNYYDLIKIVDEDTVSIVYGYDESVAEIQDPSPKKGYKFIGWSDTIPSVMPAHNVELVAQWELEWYDLTLDVDSQFSVFHYKYGDTIAPVANPTKEGYLFNGWSDELPIVMPAENVTLSATWMKSQFVLSLVDGDTTKLEMTFGQPVQVETPSKEGYTFVEWIPALPETMPSHDVVSEAMWSANQYDFVTIADSDTTIVSYAYMQTVAIPSNPTKEGYTFEKWSDTIPSVMPAENVLLSAIFTPNDYTFTVNVDDSSVAYTYQYEDTILVPSIPEKEGYQFLKWSDSIPTTMPSHDVTISAVWTTNLYNLYVIIAQDTFTYPYRYGDQLSPLMNPGVAGYTFESWSMELPKVMPDHDVVISAILNPNNYDLIVDYGDSTSVLTYSYNDTIPVINIPEKEGYTFVRWNTEIPSVMPNKNIQVAAVWEINTYSFVVMTDNDTITTTYEYKANIQIPETPSKVGHKFIGWSDTIPSTMPSHDVIVSAQFAAEQGGLTIDNGIVRVTQPYFYGDTIQPIETPTRIGYKFIGWDREIPLIMQDSNIVITALWEPEIYTLTFIADEDTVVVEYPFESVVESITVGDKEGYSFAGWTPKVPETMPAENLVVNVVWEKNSHDFTYITSKKTVTVEYAYGDSIEKPADPTRKGYRFVGWSDSIPSIMPDSSVTVEAQWEAKMYTITLMLDSAVYDTLKVAYGDTIQLPENLQKTGYKFMGWNKEVPTTMPAKNMTFVAEFKICGKLNVYTEDGMLIIYGLPENVEVIVTDVLGRLIYRGSNTTIPLAKGTVCVVRAMDQMKKINIR